MHQSKPVRLLKVLKVDEVKGLLSFLKSPFYNANPHIVKLYRLLRTHHPDFNSPKLTKKKIFAKLFPERKYDHQKLLNLMSDFNRLLTKYLQALQLEKQEWDQQRLLLEVYAERPRHYDLFQKALRKAEKQVAASTSRDAGYYRKYYYLQQLLLSHPGTDKFQIAKAEYDIAMEYLDRTFLQEKLLLSCEMKAREKPLSEKYEIWLLEEIRERSRSLTDENPVPHAYREMLNLLESGSAASYASLKSALFTHANEFTRRQRQDILQSLVNFTIQQGNRGQQRYVQENLELYQFGLETALFLEYGLLNDMIYISIVNIALRASAREWCQDFINEYEHHLEAGTRKDAKSLAKALYLYADRRLDETITLLQEVEFLNVYYQVQARVLLIKVYFESLQRDKTYYDLVCSQSESFERYLRRNKKISRAQRTGLMNFCAYIKRLAKLKIFKVYGHKKIMTELKAEITNLDPFYNKSWFLQQIN